MAQWYETRRDVRGLRAGFRAGIQGLRQVSRANNQSLGAVVRADSAHIRGNLTGLRSDIQALTVRIARIEAFLMGYFATRGPRDRHDNA